MPDLSYLTEDRHIPLLCEHLIEVAEPWMIRHALKAVRDSIDPDNRRKQLEIQAAKAWDKYKAHFDAGLFIEAVPMYADYLELKAKLNHLN